jgi:hypothetical protein
VRGDLEGRDDQVVVVRIENILPFDAVGVPF